MILKQYCGVSTKLRLEVAQCNNFEWFNMENSDLHLVYLLLQVRLKLEYFSLIF